MTYETGKIDKGWGFEIAFANNSMYSGKLLVFERAGAKTSMMFHKERSKTWFVNEGKFKLTYIETTTGKVFEHVIEAGATSTIAKMSPHQLEALEPNSIIFEVGTGDEGDTDRIRLSPGDTQTQPSAPQ
jgi:mannose-6-phosphate isomerase-like protein (cupin superfamily)